MADQHRLGGVKPIQRNSSAGCGPKALVRGLCRSQQWTFRLIWFWELRRTRGPHHSALVLRSCCAWLTELSNTGPFQLFQQHCPAVMSGERCPVSDRLMDWCRGIALVEFHSNLAVATFFHQSASQATASARAPEVPSGLGAAICLPASCRVRMLQARIASTSSRASGRALIRCGYSLKLSVACSMCARSVVKRMLTALWTAMLPRALSVSWKF